MIDDLRNNVCEVTFIKANGSERTMICTLKPEFLPASDYNVSNDTSDQRADLITVWDVEAEGWRSVKPSKVTEFKIQE